MLQKSTNLLATALSCYPWLIFSYDIKPDSLKITDIFRERGHTAKESFERFVYLKSEVRLVNFRYTALKIETKEEPDILLARFRAKKSLEGIVYDTVALEGNPFTFAEVKTLLEGITVGGHKVSDEKQVLNQAESWSRLFTLIEEKKFALIKETFCELQGIVAREEALKWGTFRDGNVTIAGTNYTPPDREQLDRIFNEGIAVLNEIECPHEKAMAFFLFGSLNQFFWDGNKRTSRLMMNGILLSSGYDVINIPAKKKLEFNQKMTEFYNDRDGSPMMAFLAGCSLDLSLKLQIEKEK
ncbi:Fic family protein [bacterium]|nr:Fic family protein [bacterium]